MSYHEVQEGNLSNIHCLNRVFQGLFFSEFSLAVLALDLDSHECQGMQEGGAAASTATTASSASGFLRSKSHNISLGSDLSIQILEKALGVWDLKSTCRSIFLVRGNSTKEFPFAPFEAINGCELWFSPADAERIMKSCYSMWDNKRIECSQSEI